MWSDSSRLEWPEQDAIPPPTLREFQMVFRDIDYASRGWVTAAEVLAAFEINNLDLHPNDVARAVQGMVALSSREGDMGSASVAARDADSRITAVAFCRCLYALSRQQRELLPNEAYAVFPDSIFTHDSELGFLRVRRDIWLLLDAPSSSKAAQAVAAFLTAAIFLSTIAFCLETLPGLHRSHGDKFASIEAACVALFTLEFSLRLFCTPDLKAFVRSPLNWIDFFSIVPFYADVFISGWDVAEDSDGLGSSILRAVRLVRVFRLLKTGRYLAWLRVFGATISESLSPLFMVGTVTCIIVTFLSSVEYFFERGRWGVVPGANVPLTNGTGSMAPSGLDSGSAWINSDGDLSSFQSIPATFWWCIITLTGGECACFSHGELRMTMSHPSPAPPFTSRIWRRLSSDPRGESLRSRLFLLWDRTFFDSNLIDFGELSRRVHAHGENGRDKGSSPGSAQRGQRELRGRSVHDCGLI